jgi:hypothetical protein
LWFLSFIAEVSMPPSDPILSAPSPVPAGYLPVALFPEHAAAPLRLCILARKDPDSVAGHFVILRTLLDAVVYLGCITDAGAVGRGAAGRLHGYVEIWIQSLAGLAGSPAAAREALSNRTLDDRWARQFKAYDALDDQPAGALCRTGFESTHPRPFFYDPEKREILQPVDAFSNAPWSLCTDDSLLASKGLPPYSSSLHRYLLSDAKSPLVPVTPDAPTGPGTAPIAEITGPKSTLIPLNPGGLMLIRRYDPAPLEGFFDLLSGGPWEGILAGRTAVHLNRLNESVEEKSGSSADMADGRLFLGKHGKWGRLIETFHLKLRLLADCLNEVRRFTAQTQRPLLNLTAQSFQVHIGEGARAYALPFLWTAAASLVDPGDAITLRPVAAGSGGAEAGSTGDAQYFLRGLSAPGNVFQPDSVSLPATGRGTLRIRKCIVESAGLILEGTFATHERLAPGGGAEPNKNDLVWLRVPVGSQRLDLFGHIEKEPALAAGEWRFRSERQRLPEAQLAQLKSAEGVPIPETLFDVIPLLSAPCDMYALAILAARALLVDADTTLAIATDELISLARQVALQYQASTPVGERIRAIFQADSRWLNSLGPHRLTRDTLTPQEAFDLVPANLWFDTLALLVRMLPGIGPDSFCRDFGDAPRGGLHKIYEGPQNHLDTLLVRTRSLIVIDWRFNREIHAVLRRFPAK